MLDQMGCSIRIKSGQLSVLNGSNLVMNGTRKNGVYVLDGEIIVGEAGVSINSVVDKTRLWHLRLGHIREKMVKGT